VGDWKCDTYVDQGAKYGSVQCSECKEWDNALSKEKCKKNVQAYVTDYEGKKHYVPHPKDGENKCTQFKPTLEVIE